MNADGIKKVLDEHHKWRNGDGGSRADLRGAYLTGADLGSADLGSAKLPHFQICPEEGEFIAYKNTTGGIVKLLIPADAKRTSSLVGRKCRASKAVVLEGSGKSKCAIGHTPIEYAPGLTVEPDAYDDDIRVECGGGIHFFITRKEAEEF